MRDPNGFTPKVRVSITIDEGVLNTCTRRLKEKGYKSLSEYIEMLLKKWG